MSWFTIVIAVKYTECPLIGGKDCLELSKVDCEIVTDRLETTVQLSDLTQT